MYTALIHEYAYEGPCRFGPPEALTQEFDLMNQAEIFKMWTQGYGGALSHIPGIHLLDPLYIKMSDEFFITEEEEQKLVDRVGKADIFIFTGMRGEGIMKEFAMRYHVPVAGEGMFVSTAEHAVLNARGYEELCDSGCAGCHPSAESTSCQKSTTAYKSPCGDQK